MTIIAKVMHSKKGFIAELSDGRSFREAKLRDIGYTLYCQGVPASNVEFEWRSGLYMLTAGQQIALTSEMRRLEREFSRIPSAA